jgi:hypothetical protein
MNYRVHDDRIKEKLQERISSFNLTVAEKEWIALDTPFQEICGRLSPFWENQVIDLKQVQDLKYSAQIT